MSVTNLKPIAGAENYNEIVSIVRKSDEESMLDFKYLTYSPQELGYPGYDSHISILLNFQRNFFKKISIFFPLL